MVSYRHHDGKRPVLRFIPAALLAVLIVIGGSTAWGQAAAPKQKTFKSPEAAVKALMAAAAAQDVKTLVALFGPGSEDIVSSGDDAADNRDRALFGKSYDEAHRLVRPGYGKRVLYVG